MFFSKKIKELESKLEIQINNNKLMNKRNQSLAEENRRLQSEINSLKLQLQKKGKKNK